jgi:hypothetical protein
MELDSPDFEPTLTLEEPASKAILARCNDLLPGKKVIARIDFTPLQDGDYILIVTSSGPAETGTYTLRLQGYRKAEAGMAE